MQLLGGLKKGLVFVVSAPAGTGKTTLVRKIVQEFDCVVESVSYTTRPPRPQETPGRDYHFINQQEFEKMSSRGEFLEKATVFGFSYGTSRSAVERLLNRGKHVVLVIDTQGAIQIKKTLDAIFIFIRPPNFEELQRRLHERRSDTQEAIDTRLSWAEREIQEAVHYDYQIVNADLAISYQVLRSILIAEEHKNRYPPQKH
ncbi:MAG: guanylate kinase [Chlamydiia bacterium]|nr:guanylate kinase [Chlamydiia bacterium]